MDAAWLDGNALAGFLEEVFGTEMTRDHRRCRSCGTDSVLGAHRAHHGAGTVLRCPACGAVAMRIVALAESHLVSVNGEPDYRRLPRP
jgi:ribosomal protein S27AE